MSDLALLGGEKTKTKPFPAWPHYDEAEMQALKGKRLPFHSGPMAFSST